MAGRRTSSDAEWKAVKEKIRARDKGICRLLRVLTVKEALLLKRTAPGYMLTQLDPAHVFPVGVHPDWCYLEDNLVTLNHYSHSNLDNMRSPIDGRPISREDRDDWWKRIVGNAQYSRLMAEVERLRLKDREFQQEETEEIE